MGRRKRFLIWITVLTAVCVIANLPRNGGSLKPFLQWAGFPWTFAFWNGDQIEWFDPCLLALDVVLAIVIIPTTAWLCVRKSPSCGSANC